MPRPSFERETIEAEIDRVRSLGVDSLRTLWRTTFRSSPPRALSTDILARFLCWHIQEQAFGGLDPAPRVMTPSRGLEALYGWPVEEAVGCISYELLATKFPVPLPAIEAELLDRGV